MNFGRGHGAAMNFCAETSVFCAEDPLLVHIQRTPESWNIGLGGLVLGSLIL